MESVTDKDLLEQAVKEAGSLWKLSGAIETHLSTLTQAFRRGGNISEEIRQRLHWFLKWPEEKKELLRIDKRRKVK